MLVVPDDVALVVDFLNTVDVDEGADLLGDEDGYQGWATHRGLRPTKRELTRRVRDALRDLLVDGDAAIPRVPLTVQVAPDGVPHIAGGDAADRVLAAVLGLVDRGEWQRLKLCPNPVCLEAFYDRSKNRSRRWCDMAGCGSTMKARAYRQRRRRSG